MKITNVRVATKSKGFVSITVLLLFELYSLRSFYNCIMIVIMRNIAHSPFHIILFSEVCLYCRYQGLTDNGSPNVFEQFLTQHQCNYYCGLLVLRRRKVMDSLQQPLKIKGARSPLLHRKLGQGSSPQIQRKGLGSPQTAKKATSSPVTVRKTNSSPKVVRKMEETEDNPKTVEISKDVTIR